MRAQGPERRNIRVRRGLAQVCAQVLVGARVGNWFEYVPARTWLRAIWDHWRLHPDQWGMVLEQRATVVSVGTAEMAFTVMALPPEFPRTNCSALAAEVKRLPGKKHLTASR